MKAGINKFLSSQMLPGCFYLVTSDGQAAAATTGARRRRSNGAATTIRLITSDGRVKTYDRAVAASELMAEFPKHMVCHSDSFCIGRKVPALSGAELLQPGHSYFLLPAHFFQSVLSFVSIASSFANRAKAGGGVHRTFEVHRTPAGELKIRVSTDEFVVDDNNNNKIRGGGGASGVEEEEEEEEAVRMRRRRVCSTDALEKDYKALVRCKSQQWKPKLETIKEYDRKRSFGRIRRKINNNNNNQAAAEEEHKHKQFQQHKILFPPTPPPPPPPPPPPSSTSSSLKKSRWKGKIVSVK